MTTDSELALFSFTVSVSTLIALLKNRVLTKEQGLEVIDNSINVLKNTASSEKDLLSTTIRRLEEVRKMIEEAPL